MKTRAPGFLLSVFLVLMSGAAHAQSPTGTIAGTVTDESGAALPGAAVVITRVETGGTRAVTTDERGRFRAPGLEPGEYEIVAELQGFQKSVRRGLRLTLGHEML